MRQILITALCLTFMVSLSPIVVAGDIDFPGVPSSGSGMYSLADIYYYLIEGRKATIPPSFQEPIAGPASTMKTLKEIYDDIEEKFEQCGVTPGQVLSTVAFFNTDTDNWGPQSGSVETRTLSDSSTTVEAGYYEQTDLSDVNSDLATGNIKQGVTVFGVDGDPDVADTSSGNAVEGEIMSGKVAWVDGSEVTGTIETQSWTSSTTAYDAGFYAQTDLTSVDSDLATGNIKSGETIFGIEGTLYVGNLLRTGDDGDGMFGEAFSYQTAVYGGGIVTIDNVTGLVWASYGDQTGCNFGNQTDWPSAIDWADALSFAEYSDWRMPNRTELNSIVNRGNYDPAINFMYFPNMQSDEYWSSTTFAADTDNAWFVNFTDGDLDHSVKTNSYYVRVVRGGIPWEVNEANVTAMDGWTWLNGAAWSDAIADSVSWNKGTDNNTGNTGTYTPNSSGTLKSRMEAVVAGRWSEVCTSINGVAITTGHDGAAGKPYISALAIADCVDGARDLTDPIGGSDWSARNTILANWAAAPGSALPEPSAYNTACTEAGGNFYENTSTLSPGANWCLGAACGNSSGDYWGTDARGLGYGSCSPQNRNHTSSAYAYLSFRVVVRPAAE